MKQTEPDRDGDARVDEDAGNQPGANSSMPESLNGSSSLTVKTKESDLKLQTEPADGLPSNHMSSFVCDEIMTPAVQQGAAQKRTERDTENISAPTQIENRAGTSNECHAGDQDFYDVTFGPYQAVTKEVKSESTQTEGNAGTSLVDVKPSGRPGQNFLDAGTQTDTHQKKYDSDATDSPPLSPTPASETTERLFSGSFPIPANPAHLAERIRRNRSRMSAAYDDTEYEPYGLPEVVMKGVCKHQYFIEFRFF